MNILNLRMKFRFEWLDFRYRFMNPIKLQITQVDHRHPSHVFTIMQDASCLYCTRGTGSGPWCRQHGEDDAVEECENHYNRTKSYTRGLLSLAVVECNENMLRRDVLMGMLWYAVVVVGWAEIHKYVRCARMYVRDIS
jgi:hypothetical protein